jgi:hypothetical protein
VWEGALDLLREVHVEVTSTFGQREFKLCGLQQKNDTSLALESKLQG